MRVYAVVGGIAAGKTTVCRLLAGTGGVVLSADRVGHRALDLRRVRQQLLALFGPGIVGADGAVDRRRLGRLVFGKPAALRALDAVVHPEIARLLATRLAALRRRGVRLVFLDAALFLDFGAALEVDGVLAVVAPRRLRRERLLGRDRLSRSEIEARLGSQPRLAVWTRRADVRIDTDCSRAELAARVQRAWQELRRRHRGPRGRKKRVRGERVR